jgi:NADH:ubiquinone oxidoreductase subunit C
VIASVTRKAGAAEVFDLLKSLKDEGFNVLVDLTCVDYSAHSSGRPERFELTYRLMKLEPETGADRGRMCVQVPVAEAPPVLRSVRSLWPIADWLEREVWDMYGVGFIDRPDIKRLLLYESFQGHALRKDYPIAKRQPQIGPPSGDLEASPSFNIVKPGVDYR